MVTSADDARLLMSVQTASDSGTRYDAMPDDDVGLHLEFGRRHVFFALYCIHNSNFRTELDQLIFFKKVIALFYLKNLIRASFLC